MMNEIDVDCKIKPYTEFDGHLGDTSTFATGNEYAPILTDANLMNF
jgi:hypothetical protein